VGFAVGLSLTTGDNNIDISHARGGGEANTIRFGNGQTGTFIAGISGVPVTGTAVVVNIFGQLGLAPSSQRFKDDIKPIDKASESLLRLKPVTFRYKKEIDPEARQQFGLVAEEVEKVNPNLVVRDKEGKPYSVRYDQVNAMLLNEFLKEHQKVEQQAREMQKQEATIVELKSTVAQQQKAMETVTTQLKEQAAQIQKVSAQLESTRPDPPVVVNNP
jgi:hypothetical protein